VFGGITTLHFGKGRAPYLLLPVVPPQAEVKPARGTPPKPRRTT
jgi:hypothetical protein